MTNGRCFHEVMFVYISIPLISIHKHFHHHFQTGKAVCGPTAGFYIVHANRMPNQQWWLVSSTGWCNNAITHFRPRTSDSGTMRGKVTVIKKERDRVTLTHSTDLMLSMVVLSIMYICWRQKSKCTHSFTETYYVCASPAKWESSFPVLRKGGDQLQTELQTRGDGVHTQHTAHRTDYWISVHTRVVVSFQVILLQYSCILNLSISLMQWEVRNC